MDNYMDLGKGASEKDLLRILGYSKYVIDGPSVKESKKKAKKYQKVNSNGFTSQDPFINTKKKEKRNRKKQTGAFTGSTPFNN